MFDSPQMIGTPAGVQTMEMVAIVSAIRLSVGMYSASTRLAALCATACTSVPSAQVKISTVRPSASSASCAISACSTELSSEERYMMPTVLASGTSCTSRLA